MTTKCTVEGCANPGKVKGLCGPHYYRLRTHGDPLKDAGRLPRNANRGCAVPGCTKPHEARGYCREHYGRLVRHGDPTGTPAPHIDRGCKVPGCGEPHRCKGYCAEHYGRWSRHGDPLAGKPSQVKGRTCSVSGCDEPHRGKGYCNKHLLRFRRYGDPLGYNPLGPASPLHRRILKQSRLDRQTGCWVWTGALVAGYGAVWVNGKEGRVHVLFCEHRHGPRPEGQVTRHLCGNPACFNPAHLCWGTQKENLKDREAHGTMPWGENNVHAKLDDQTVRDIRRSNAKGATIAGFLGVSKNTVYDARSGKSWKHVVD